MEEIKSPKDFFEFARKNSAEMVDLKFVDLLGTWQHCSFPIDTWDERTFEEGVGFDGSSIRGWQGIHMSDMLAVPDFTTALTDPFFVKPTVSVIANIIDPITREQYSRDPRFVAQKGVKYLKETGIADTCNVGPEPEFFIFDEIRYDQTQNMGFYQIDSVEGAWYLVLKHRSTLPIPRETAQQLSGYRCITPILKPKDSNFVVRIPVPMVTLRLQLC
jgi:glutamine synthetase